LDQPTHLSSIIALFSSSFHLEIQTDMSASFAKLSFIFVPGNISFSGEVLIGFAPPWPIVDDLPERHKL
jgi:hypothetical protein